MDERVIVVEGVRPTDMLVFEIGRPLAMEQSQRLSAWLTKEIGCTVLTTNDIEIKRVLVLRREG